nr:MAG TPA: hypothetical protein [Caudoviricetes sp.]
MHLALIVQSTEGGRERLTQSVHQRYLADHGSLFAVPKRLSGVVFTELDFLIAGTGAVFAVDLRPAAQKGLAAVSTIIDDRTLTVQQLAICGQDDHASFKTIVGRVTLGHLQIAVLTQHNGACGVGVLVVVVDEIGFLGEGVQVILLAGLQKDLAFGVGGLRADEAAHLAEADREVLTIGSGDLHRHGRGCGLHSGVACTVGILNGTVCQRLDVGNGAGCGGRRCAGTSECHKQLPPKLFDRTIAEAALCGSLLEPCNVLPGELHPEAVLFAVGFWLRGRLCKTLQHLTVQPPGCRDQGVGLRFLRGLCLDLAFFIGRRDNDRSVGLRTLCGLPLGLCAALGVPGILAAAVLHKGGVQIQFTQILGGAGFGVLAAVLPDEPQLLPPGLHALAQLPAGLCQIIGLVEPLGHQQAVKGDHLPQLADAVDIDSPQGVGLVLPFGFLHSLDLLVNGTGDGLAPGLHLLCALQEFLQRLHVKGLCTAGSVRELLVQLVHGGAVGLGILDGLRGVDAAGVGGQHLGQVLLHLGFIPPDRGQLRVLDPDGQFLLHKYSPRIHNVHISVKHPVQPFRLSLCQFIGNHDCIRSNRKLLLRNKRWRLLLHIVNSQKCHL